MPAMIARKPDVGDPGSSDRRPLRSPLPGRCNTHTLQPIPDGGGVC